MILILLLFWLLLSGHITVFFMISALISIAAIILIDKKLFITSPLIININWRWIIFISQLLKEMLMSTIMVAKYIWLKPKSITPCYGLIDSKAKNLNTKIIYANSITLTPGTMSMEIKDNKIMVHALNLEAMQELQQAKLEQQVLNLEQK